MKVKKTEMRKRVRNSVVFLAPALLVFLTAVQSGVPADQALIAVYTWLVNAFIDLTKKFIASNKAE